MAVAQWGAWVDAAVSRLDAGNRLYYVRPVSLPPPPAPESFDGPGPWDCRTVEVAVDRDTLADWLSQGGGGDEVSAVAARQEQRQLVLFSGNDFLGLSSHPAVRKAASKAAEEHGMGPRGSAVVCGYTTYHKSLEESLAQLKRKQSCVLCPTGYAANVALMTALGSVSSILAGSRRRPSEEDRVAVFSDALNHVSIIDGIRLVERQGEAKLFVYSHRDTAHLDALLKCEGCIESVATEEAVEDEEGETPPKHGIIVFSDPVLRDTVVNQENSASFDINGESIWVQLCQQLS